MQNHDIAAIRSEYTKAELTKRSVKESPLDQFQVWFNDALQAQVLEPTAMTLATVHETGMPSARIVLLKGLEDGTFRFFTNYTSTKARDLENNPGAALVFFWPELERQIRIEGTVAKVAVEVSDAYFASRPFTSQIGAIASDQSAVLPSRDVLEERIKQLTQEHASGTVNRPEHWGGYALTPSMVEFWQGRESRLHDRIQYVLTNGTWHISRLNP